MGKSYAKKTVATRYLRESDVVVIKTSIKERFGQTVFLPFPTTIPRGRIFEIETSLFIGNQVHTQ